MKKMNFLCIFFVFCFLFAGCNIGNGTDGDKFESSTNETISNDIATLGLEGTSATSDKTNVATVGITTGNKIRITSVSEGSAVITISNDLSHTATIAITVSKTGSIIIGTIDKYSENYTGPKSLKLINIEGITNNVAINVGLSSDGDDNSWVAGTSPVIYNGETTLTFQLKTAIRPNGGISDNDWSDSGSYFVVFNDPSPWIYTSDGSTFVKVAFTETITDLDFGMFKKLTN
jgi:hypothetical protein